MLSISSLTIIVTVVVFILTAWKTFGYFIVDDSFEPTSRGVGNIVAIMKLDKELPRTPNCLIEVITRDGAFVFLDPILLLNAYVSRVRILPR